jgi:hypothetical protein
MSAAYQHYEHGEAIALMIVKLSRERPDLPESDFDYCRCGQCAQSVLKVSSIDLMPVNARARRAD